MKPVLLVLLFSFRVCGDAPDVELIPESRMGARGIVKVEEIQWNSESEWWGKKVEVCRVVNKAPDPAPIIAMAKTNYMKEQKTWDCVGLGVPGDGTIYFHGKEQGRFAMVNPNTGYVSFGLLPSDDFPRDANWKPIVQPLPSKEDAVKICREWMKRLGIDENQLTKDPRRPGGFKIDVFPEAEKGWDKEQEKYVPSYHAMSLVFTQQVGKFPSFWNGGGGCLWMTLTDGGKFSNMHYCFRGYEPMGEYEILSRDELTEAIRSGFCWSGNSIREKSLRVDRVIIEAYQAGDDVAQKHFPLIYHLVVRPVSADPKSDYDLISIPALKIHRYRYRTAHVGDKTTDEPTFDSGGGGDGDPTPIPEEFRKPDKGKPKHSAPDQK